MSKFTPATVMVLMVWVVAMVNVTVAVTPAVPATLLDSTMEGEVSAAVKLAAVIAGKATKFTPSMFATGPSFQVEMVTPVVAAAAAAAFFSPANLHSMIPLLAPVGALMLSTKLVVDNEAAPADMPVPVQVMGEVG